MARRAKGEGSIYQTRDGRWVAQIRLHDGKYKRWSRQTKQEAADELSAFRARQLEGRPEPGNTLEGEMRRWLQTVKRESVKPTTYMRLVSTAENHVYGRIGSYRVGQLTTRVIQEQLINKMTAEGLSYSSVKKARDILGDFLNHYITTNDMAATMSNAARGVELQRAPVLAIDADKYLDDAMCDAFIKECRTGKYKQGELLELLLLTGMRAGEGAAIKAKDINLQNKTLTVRSTVVTTRKINAVTGKKGQYKTQTQDSAKTRSGRRIVPLNARAEEILRGRSQGKRPDDLLFPGTGKSPVPVPSLDKTIKKIFKEIGWEGKGGCHVLRHSYASAILRAGQVDIKKLQEILGHKSISITGDIYSHVQKELEYTSVRPEELLFDPTPEVFRK